jgi:hypothetical protein
MATVADVTFSMYTRVKQFADSVNFGFYSASNVEAAASLLQEPQDRVILVQTKVDTKVFLTLEYSIFFSFATTTDVNSVEFTELVSKCLEAFPEYKPLCVYEAEGLKEVPSKFNDTGIRMVIVKVRQETASITQMKSSLSMITIKLSGYIN